MHVGRLALSVDCGRSRHIKTDRSSANDNDIAGTDRAVFRPTRGQEQWSSRGPKEIHHGTLLELKPTGAHRLKAVGNTEGALPAFGRL